ncbi:MAG: phosphoribosylanthranilate isomerase [Caldilineales bacterium]
MTPSITETSEPIGSVKIKICGLTNVQDAQVSAEAGADLLGFIFYKKSPRYVAPETVAGITAVLRLTARCPLLVGVFVNETPAVVAATLDRCGLDLAQLHGEETPDALAALAGRSFKALRPRTADEAERAVARFAPLAATTGPAILLDAWHPALRGGTGDTGDWQVAAGVAAKYRVLLAGGLSPDNVTEAIRQVRPWGVDVASGVEASPGRKDHSRVREFVAAVRECQLSVTSGQ